MDENPKGLKTLNSSYFFTFMGFDLFPSSTISAPILPFFFHYPSHEELSLDIILWLSQIFFVIQQIYSQVNQILDLGISPILVMAEADMTRLSRTSLD